MSNDNLNILDKARHAGLARPDGGMAVPEGYFQSFLADMESRLPSRPELEQTAPATSTSFWGRVRPYAYMAAMFAGIWLMLQLFNIIGSHTDLAPIDSNPVLANALSNENFPYDFIYTDVSTYDVLEDMDNEGLLDSIFTPEEFGSEILSDTIHILPQ